MVADGVNGWSLEDYSWDPKTGVGTYTYERFDEEHGPLTCVLQKAQPYHPSHTGWLMLNKYV